MTLQTITHLAAISGGMLYIMAVVLLIGLAVIVDRTWTLWRFAVRGERARRLLVRHAELDASTLRNLGADLSGPYRAMFEMPAQRPDVRDNTGLSDLLDETIMTHAPHIDRRLWVLDTTVTLGPLLGLLGTIIGIFHAFKVLGNPGSAPAQITGGVAEALIATAAGLFIAIIGLIFFNGLQNRVRLVVHQMETVKAMLINRLTGKGEDPA